MPNIEFLTEQRFTLSSHLIEVALKHNLSLEEFLLLLYFEDTMDKTFDIEHICKVLSMKEEACLEAFNHLLTLNLINLESYKDKTNKQCDRISLEPFYKELFAINEKKKKKEEKASIFDLFQKELGRKISPMEYEIINQWLIHGYSEELIIGALKEAVYNGVSSLRYIDRILFEWNKKGYHNMQDVEDDMKSHKKNKNQNLEIFEYNWLEDES